MSEGQTYRVELTGPAVRDYDEIIDWTILRFGDDAAGRYADLLAQALEDLESDPFRYGSRHIPGSQSTLFTYHLAHSRRRVRPAVKKPRHVVLYRLMDQTVYVLRILHDARDLLRNLPEDE